MVNRLDVHFTRCTRCHEPVECITLDDHSIIRLDPTPRRAMMRPHGNELVNVQIVHACRGRSTP